MTSPVSTLPITRYSTAHLPPSERYAEWMTWDWPRTEPIFRTVPSEDFNAVMESVPLGQLLFVRTEITGMGLSLGWHSQDGWSWTREYEGTFSNGEMLNGLRIKGSRLF